MAEHETGSADRTLEPTAKRLREAREQGQLPRSRELAGAAIAAAAIATLFVGAAPLGGAFVAALEAAFRVDPGALGSAHGAVRRLAEVGAALFLPVLPLIGACLAAAVLGSLALGGINVSVKAITPDLKRVDPVAGLKRLFSLTALGEVGKSMLRVLLVGAVAAGAVLAQRDAIVGLPGEAAGAGIAHALEIVRATLLALVAALIAVALLDVPFQNWSYRRKLKMTPEELRKEVKETEGNPEVKGRIRRLQQELARRRMLEDVPRADVVLTNPTHVAVALKYDAGSRRAPRVVAKGAELIAARIREIAEQHRVPVVSAPPLARALYRSTDIGEEIPVRAYQAVAQVLSFVYQLKAWRRHGGKAPKPPDIRIDEDAFDPRRR